MITVRPPLERSTTPLELTDCRNCLMKKAGLKSSISVQNSSKMLPFMPLKKQPISSFLVEVTQIYSQTVCEMEIESKKNKNTSRDKEITGNSSKDATSTGPRGLLDGAEIPKSIGNLSKDTVTGTGPRGVLYEAEMLENRELKLGSEKRVQVDSFAHQTPEDVLRVFMMKEFIGTRYLDDLLVPHHRQHKKV